MKLSTSPIRFRMFSIGLKSVKSVASLTLLAALAACSGTTSTSDGSGSGSGSDSGTTASTAASLSLLVSSPQMNSDGKTDVTFTVLAKDAGNAGVANQPVTIAATSGAVTLDAQKTDASGKVTGTLSTLGDPSNREITLRATSGTATATNTVNVSGTALQVTGSSSLVFGNTTELQVSVKDSAGVGIDKVDVKITSAKSNTLSAQTVKTDSSGQAKVKVTGATAGSDVISFSALGASKDFALAVSASNFQFTAPASDTQISIGTPVNVSVKWEEGGVPKANAVVSFSSTRGTISSTAATDAGGIATATISSTESGNAIITASAPNGAPFNTLPVSFVAVSAARVDVQSDKSIVAVYKAGSTTSLATISAIVRDATNNLVKNAKVNFKLLADPSGGVLDNSVSTTDEGGLATVQYRAGSSSSGQNAVKISATVTDVNGVAITPISSTMSLTVGAQSLFIRLGTDNLLGSASPLYKKTWTALVTDSAGNPVPNITVQFRLRPAASNAYTKGRWIDDGMIWTDRNGNKVVDDGEVAPATTWVRVPSVVCQNEDLDFNGIMGPTEDFNGNGMLTPGNVASVNGSAITDPAGIATATITYAKEYATWANVTLQAAVQVAGTEYTQAVDYALEILVADYSDLKVYPPGRLSPFGTASSCSNPS